MVDKIIEQEDPDYTIYLGDFFDDFKDKPKDATKTAKWLKTKIHLNKTDVFLIGNHDFAYYTYFLKCNNRLTSCAGFTVDKALAINDILGNKEWSRLKYYHILDNWLFTHAGLNKSKVYTGIGTIDVKAYLASEEAKVNEKLNKRLSHPFWECGWARGGDCAVGGGLLWNDWSEFVPILGINQLFGHSPSSKGIIRKIDIIEDGGSTKNLCIDTHSMHYAVYFEKEMIVYAR